MRINPNEFDRHYPFLDPTQDPYGGGEPSTPWRRVEDPWDPNPPTRWPRIGDPPTRWPRIGDPPGRWPRVSDPPPGGIVWN